MVGSQLHEFAACCTALVVNLDGILDVIVCDLSACNLLQLFLNVCVLIHCELKAEVLKTVLRMS